MRIITRIVGGIAATAALASVAVADIRTLIVLDISGSIESTRTWNDCSNQFFQCLVPLYQVQQQAVLGTLAQLPDPPCAESYLQVAHFSYISWTGEWLPISTSTQREQTRRHLNTQWRVPRNEGTQILDAFQRTAKVLQATQAGMATLIFITDGRSKDGWSVEYGHAEAERRDFVFHQITVSPLTTGSALAGQLHSILTGIHEAPYQCFG